MIIRASRLSLASLLLLAIAACTSMHRANYTKGCKQIVEEYYAISLSEQISEYRERDLDEQFALYRCSLGEPYSPNPDFSIPIAQRGQSAVPFLEEELRKTDDDREVYGIVTLFKHMALLESYSVAEDAELLSLVRDRIEGMEDGVWRHRTVEILEGLRAKDGDGP